MSKKKTLAEVFAARSAKQTAMQTKVSNAGVLGLMKKDDRFLRGNKGTAL